MKEDALPPEGSVHHELVRECVSFIGRRQFELWREILPPFIEFDTENDNQSD